AAAPAVTPATVFDLASLTKVCATLPTVLALVAQQRLALDDPLQKWLPEFTGAGKEQLTLRQLLLHRSGLPASVPFYRTLQGKDAIVAAAAHADLVAAPPGAVVYSDLGFLLLAAVVERCCGRPFDAVARRETFTALGMRGARFVAADTEPIDAAPTEDDPARGGVVQGRVHDENAAAMGGVAGHAGLFGTADDVLRIGLCFLGGGRSVLPRPLVAAATTPQAGCPERTRALGFELPRAGGWAGTIVDAGTFGHTGFTGTSLWCDAQNDLCVVLLTNRVHPSRVNDKITAVRRALHDLVLQALQQ
ncbi:MAG TPA: serine hydrolase domain-containing protein, partial [Planctomycetota bacterium]|nr:serine hydrolase domain-containing protein [Planctomycetota bacterium]